MNRWTILAETETIVKNQVEELVGWELNSTDVRILHCLCPLNIKGLSLNYIIYRATTKNIQSIDKKSTEEIRRNTKYSDSPRRLNFNHNTLKFNHMNNYTNLKWAKHSMWEKIVRLDFAVWKKHTLNIKTQVSSKLSLSYIPHYKS